MEYSLQNNKGMTFVEMLIVIAIISILFASFFYIWNTMDIFRKSRDSKRVNDLQLLDTALKTILSTENNINLGEENIIYTSLPDSSSTCGTYNLVSILSPYFYRCQTQDNYLKVDGSGWLPVDLTLGKILTVSALPVDPLNNKDYFYTYQVRQGRYKLTARFENQGNISKMVNDGGFEPTLYEVGSDLFIPSPHSGLVGYWSFDEGTGTIAYDLSGYGHNGTLYNFNFTTTSGWATGKIGGALSFDGANDYVGISDKLSLSYVSIVTWAKDIETMPQLYEYIVSNDRDCCGTYNGYSLLASHGSGGVATFRVWNSTIYSVQGITNTTNQWHFFVATFNGELLKLYIDGQLEGFSNYKGAIGTPASFNFAIGGMGYNPSVYNMKGLIDEVRVYGRALTDSEIKALYDATK